MCVLFFFFFFLFPLDTRKPYLLWNSPISSYVHIMFNLCSMSSSPYDVPSVPSFSFSFGAFCVGCFVMDVLVLFLVLLIDSDSDSTSLIIILLLLLHSYISFFFSFSSSFLFSLLVTYSFKMSSYLTYYSFYSLCVSAILHIAYVRTCSGK